MALQRRKRLRIVGRWWAAAAHPAFTIALPISYFDRLGIPRLAGR